MVNGLLGLAMFGVRCCDCYVVNTCCDLYVFWEEWNVRGVNVEQWRQNSTLWYSSVNSFEF